MVRVGGASGRRGRLARTRIRGRQAAGLILYCFTLIAFGGCASSEPLPLELRGSDGRVWLGLSDLDVTLGSIERVDEDLLRIVSPKVRAVSQLRTGDDAELSFRYLGPTDEVARLSSGELRRQIGLKLRAADSCNVVYVMWMLAPTPGIKIHEKWNPGLSSHGECGASGYSSVGGLIPAPSVRTSSEHSLRARLDGRRIRVWADGLQVYDGELSGSALRIDGPAGLRSDNGRFEFRLGVVPPPTM